MVATLTSKGQITLPKGIRDRLGLEAGDRLDFQLNKDGTIQGRPLKRGVLHLAGIAKPADGRVRALEEIEEAILLEAAENLG
jgi:AbrB family looped-hinge helix DNA binding protein